MDENAEVRSRAAVYHVRHEAIYRKQQGMRSKFAILLAVGALLLVLGAGVALADSIACQAGIACDGTSVADRMTGTNANDLISGFGGKDKIQDTAKQDVDTIAGGGQNDTISVREGNGGLNNRDFVDCGKGDRDRVFYDTGDVGDKIARCEIKNPS
jgi:Ca2+-binding RTX toxin-like protein